jgi:hypothetical protein
VRLLVANGAAKDWKEDMTLPLAASNGHEGVARFLVEEGMDLEAMDGDGHMALHLSAANGHMKRLRGSWSRKGQIWRQNMEMEICHCTLQQQMDMGRL